MNALLLLRSLIRPLMPYAIGGTIALILAYFPYQQVRTERKALREVLVLTQDSLHRSQTREAQTQVKYLTLLNRDAQIQAAYERQTRLFAGRVDSLKRAIASRPVVQQRAYIQTNLGAAPVSEWTLRMPGPQPITTLFRVTCYDSTGLLRIAEATGELLAYRNRDSLQTRAYEQLLRGFRDYREAMTEVAGLPWWKSKGRAIRRLNERIDYPPES